MRTNDWQEFVHEIGEIAARCGITFSQSHLPYYDVFNNTDEEKATLYEKLIHRSIVGTRLLGAKWAVTHPCTDFSSADMSVLKQKNIDYIMKHIEVAESNNIGIALENDFLMKTKQIYASNVEELCDLVDTFNSPSVGVCYDFGHAELQGDDHRGNLNYIGKKRLKCVHVHDNHGECDEHLMPFYGIIDWENAMAGLHDIEYEGELTYEIQEFARHLPDDMKYLVVQQSIEIGKRLLLLGR